MPSKASAEPYATRRAAGAASREATRARLLAAADELFRRDGYPATTVSAIAARAGVSLQTLYLAWGSKTALFRAAADAAATGSDIPLDPEQWRSSLDHQLDHSVGSSPTAQDYLTQVARLFTTVAARSITYWRMQPAAAAADSDIATGHQNAMNQRRSTMAHVAASIPRPGLRHDLDAHYIADTLWTLASPETYTLLTASGYNDDRYADWLTTTLQSALCTTDSNTATAPTAP